MIYVWQAELERRSVDSRESVNEPFLCEHCSACPLVRAKPACEENYSRIADMILLSTSIIC